MKFSPFFKQPLWPPFTMEFHVAFKRGDPKFSIAMYHVNIDPDNQILRKMDLEGKQVFIPQILQ